MAAKIRNRMTEIEMEVRNCEDLLQASHNANEKAGLQRQMSKLTTEYINLATKVASMI